MYISSEQNLKPQYHPGLERWSPYKTLWVRNWNNFQKIYQLRFQELYGPLTDEKKEQVEKLIRCGKFQNGFQRHTCHDCGTVLIVPFTCKSRLCLSCARKKLFGWSLNLSHIMNTSFRHTHVTFTIPGKISKLLFERKYEPEQMIPLAASVYKSILVTSAKLKGKEYQPGIMATLHKSGNGLNYNPHIHLIGTREIIDTKTGEIIDVQLLPYRKIRFIWQKAFLNHLFKTDVITNEEYNSFINIYKNGFHVFFQPIRGDQNDVLFRTAEYLAAGFFHNTQIQEINYAKRTISFRYKKSMERDTRIKHYAIITMDIYEFMARMLYFLPEKHRKMLRYYGIYAHNIEKKLNEIDRKTWVKAIEHSFEKNPEVCPECSSVMIRDIVFSFSADREMRKLIKTHRIYRGYFISYQTAIKPP